MARKKNLTLSIDSDLILSAKTQANKLGKSLNEMIRDFLVRSSKSANNSNQENEFITTLDDAFRIAKKGKWTRADAYDE